LFAQDGLVPIELTFELRNELLDALLVRRRTPVLLEHPLEDDAPYDRVKLRIFDARRLLELCASLGLGRD